MIGFLGGCSGCNGLPEAPNVPPSTRPSFGELVYRILKGQLNSADQCPSQYVAALETHHADFVTTFDYVIDHGVQDDFPELLGGTIKPFIDDDKLPRLVDTLAATLALLVSDEFDPDRETIRAMVDLSEARTLLESSVAIQLVASVLEDPAIVDKVHALATIAQENDGVTYLMDDALDVASYALEADPTPSTCTGLVTPDVQTTLLRTQGFVEDARFALGTPFYLARADANGNPAVASSAGTLLGGFVDANRDGVADVNAEGDPVNAAGGVIDLAMIGEDSASGRDVYGRAIDAQGRTIYQYYDVKRTALSYALQIVADLFQADVHHRIPAIANAALGAPTTCTNGSNCRIYPSNQNVLADLVWMAFEVAEYGRVSVLTRTLTQLLTTDVTKAEQLLVAIGDVIRALDATNIQLTDTSITDAVTGLVPLLAQVFAAPSANGLPTARVLVDVLQALGAQGDALPEDVNYMIRNQYDGDAPGKIEAVNLSLPRFPAGGDDNRTGLEQLIELFDYADCGSIAPDSSWAGINVRNGIWLVVHAVDPQTDPGTVAQVFVSLLSHQSVGTVKTLIDLLLGVQSIPIIGSLVGNVIESLGCSSAQADKIEAHLPALKVLADSGGLDWILPLAATFESQGQLRLLIDIFKYLAADFRLDEDASTSTASSVRRLMPALKTMTTRVQSNVVNSTPLNRILDTLKVLLTIPASDGNGNSVDVMIDAISYMSTPRTIQTRPISGTLPGNVSSSYLVQLLSKLRTMQQRIAAGGAGDELTFVVDSITPLLTQTTGTGTSRKLANPNLRLLAATFLEVASQATTLPQAGYLCYVGDLQRESTDFLNTKHFATLVRIFNHLATSSSAGALEDWVLTFLRGRPADRPGELYGRVLQLAAGALSSQASGDDLSKILDWLGASLQVSGAGGAREMVQTLDALIQSDVNGTFLTIVRTLIAAGPLASHERPLSTFADVASDVNAIDGANACMATGAHLDPGDVEDLVQDVCDFLVRSPTDNRTSGIESVWALVGTLAPAE